MLRLRVIFIWAYCTARADGAVD